MKKKNTLLIAFAIFMALVIGFVIGALINYPPVNDAEISGTIGKVKNYRNAKASEADIQLKNDLLADSAMLESVKNYMNFYYVRALEFGKNIDFAVKEANANEAFKTKNTQKIIALESYGEFLRSARKHLLIAVSACQSAKETDPVVLRNSIIRANDVIAQMTYRNKAVLNFITELEAFIQEAGTDKYPALNKAHDLLTYNEIISSLILKDQVLIKFFDKKKLYSKDFKSSGPADLKEMIKQDVENLKALDAEKLGAADAEQLGFLDTEKLSEIIEDAESLGVFDTENLGVFDAENLGIIFDAEKLGLVFDAEKLSEFMDAEALGSF
ncbi:MAG: hypothetical protein AB2L24_29320 [Mangrovibacterium sp.]